MYWIIYCGENEAICFVCDDWGSFYDCYSDLVSDDIEIFETSED